MNYDGYFEELKARLAARYGQPVEAAVMVHRSPETGGNAVARAFGARSPEAKLHTNNVLVMTPTHLRLVALGGRSGVKPRDEVAAWDRRHVVLEIRDTERGSWMRTTMSWYSYEVHRLRISGPDLTMVVDAMAKNRHVDPVVELTAMFDAVGVVTPPVPAPREG